ncbi:glycoside hydrolase family 65 protein [Streptomyces albidoflavus]
MTSWTWEYDEWVPADEQLRESLCTLGNGYFATRGAFPECDADDIHYPGTYAAGVFNRLTSHVSGRDVENEDMVNLPNWLPLRVRRVDGENSTWFTPGTARVVEHSQTLRLDAGVLERRTRYEDPDGRLLLVRQTRLVSMENPHLAALRTELTAENWEGEVEVEAALDGTVTNSGVARYRDLDGRHLTALRTGAGNSGDVAWLTCSTTNSDIEIALAARHALPPGTQVEHADTEGRSVRRFRLDLRSGHSQVVDKIVALYTGHDRAIADPRDAAVEHARTAPAFDQLVADQRAAWRDLWRRAELDVPNKAGLILRLHLFQVLQTLSPHTAELDAGVPARGLHGEAYRGHIFWDELFVLRYLNLHFPEVSRALLTYRHRRLEHAVAAAEAIGLAGAMYPWQSGSDGREETQQLHLNPRSGRWLEDHSHLQRHVGSAIAYNVIKYYEASGDAHFHHTKGAEMLLQIARFWVRSATWDPELSRYRILGVMGPDEYHEAYPGAERPGLDDNAYTNITATWVITRALDLLRNLPAPRRAELALHTGFDAEEEEHWEEVTRNLHIPFHSGVISQFDGYGELQELDWDGYRAKYGDIRRLDRILEAEGDTVDRYQASKQADVLMLGYLFSPSELAELFARLGYTFDDALWGRTVEYYLRRTSHGSTLSGLVHGWVLARVRRTDAWTFVLEALRGDIADLQGGTTGEGIHLGAMAGTLDLVQSGLTGLETRPGGLALDPVPLPELSHYRFSLRYQGHWGVHIQASPGTLDIAVPASDRFPITITLPQDSFELAPGESRRVLLDD